MAAFHFEACSFRDGDIRENKANDFMSAIRSQIVEQLRGQLRTSQPMPTNREVVSSGLPTLDHLLPESGIPTGALVEWVEDGPGMRTTSIAFKTASQFLNRPGAFAVVDSSHCLCAASLPQLGIPLSRLLLVRPSGNSSDGPVRFSTGYHLPTNLRKETLWALEQLARCTGVGVVLTWIDRLSATAQRRLQLAVERSGTTVFLIRPRTVLSQPTWADLRFHVKSKVDHRSSNEEASMISSNLEISLVRSRNSVRRHGKANLECKHETGVVSETQ